MDGKFKIVIVLSLLLFLNFCGDNGVRSSGIIYSGFEDNPCDSKNISNSIQSNNLLFYYAYERGELELDFRFTCNCASAFKDSVKLEDNSIYIALKDTIGAYADCVCDHQSLFNFNILNKESVNLKLDIDYGSNQGYISVLDTVIAIN